MRARLGSNSPALRIGVVGTLVWDRIWRWDSAAPVEAWGGITYSLAAAAAHAPPGWEVVPIVKVGDDLAADALDFLGSLPRVNLEGVVRTGEPNNRVELRYTEAERRQERLIGGVSAWGAVELEQAVLGLDALYVNFISGQEMDLAVAEHLREVFPGPIYGDLHSLLLDIDPGGSRSHRPLPDWERWVACLDVVQLNEDELAAIAAGDDPWGFAEEQLGPLVDRLVVTRGTRGVWCREVSDPDCRENGVVHDVPTPAVHDGDPTGCGDVFGSTLFLGLLTGMPVKDAIMRAQLAAAASVAVSGADRVYEVLSVRP